ncbi:MAG TPA: tRNA (adenosine(37)-N6)-threonylcarbamoyltransferase complex dimerization subunit type 1 TsaB [Bacillota bacterium]|nr:tRNA (adenosine(37)-N6)-threonylcarbamoyltransferase complex dimerization subunit type 1 TsaB [Bacillota bacterium]
MLILGIDTATPWGSLALAEDDELIFEVSLKVAKGGGEYLISIMDRLFEKAGRRLADLTLIATGVGPGSYTGIRVGLATVAGLAEALAIPVFGINTLRIVAENARYNKKGVAVALDARRGEVYGAFYQCETAGVKEILTPQAIKAEQFAVNLKGYEGVILCGDGGKRYRDVFERVTGLEIAPERWDRPLAGLAIEVARQEWRGPETAELRSLIPEYLKKVEAEIRLEEKLGGANSSGANVCRGPGGCTGN